MTLPTRSTLLRLALSLGMLASLMALEARHSLAEARAIRSDRSDNTFYFTYDADKGEIPTASSSLQVQRRDPVSQQVYIDAVPGAEIGSRLKATVLFRLNAKEKRGFRGSLTLEIRDARGQVVHEAVREVDFVLRPRPGERRQRVSFRFDLPSGDYSALSIFNAPPP